MSCCAIYVVLVTWCELDMVWWTRASPVSQHQYV